MCQTPNLSYNGDLIMSIVTGTVEAYSNKFDKHSILVNGKWYSSKFEIKAEKGDTVEFDDGGKSYVRKCKVVGKAGSGSTSPAAASAGFSRTPGFPVPVDTKDRSIVRQNAVKVAAEIVNFTTVSPTFKTWEEREEVTQKFAELVVATARVIEDYTAGDSDMEAAVRMLDGEE